MKKFALKRPNGRIVSISDDKPKDVGNFLVEEVDVEDIEEVKKAKSVWHKDNKMVLERDEQEQVSTEITTLLEKLADKKSSMKDVQDGLSYLLRKYLENGKI
jgi:hypothetical protein